MRLAALAVWGRFGQARAMIERLRRQLEDLGTAFSLNTLGFVVGAMEIWAGRPDLAERRPVRTARP